MTDGPERSAIDRRDTDCDAVASLASQALSVLANRRLSREPALIEKAVARLGSAVVHRDPAERDAVLDELRSLGINDTDISEVLVPEVARRLGDAWCEDGMSFADVTIGSARLQSMVRRLAPTEEDSVDLDAALVAVVVPDEEFHTLGAMVLTSKLRRHGVSVKLLLGKSDGAVAGALAADRVDAVFVSIARSEKLVSLAGFVKKLRQSVANSTPIVVGGPAALCSAANVDEIGADCITSDFDEALKACRLTTFRENADENPAIHQITSPTF